MKNFNSNLCFNKIKNSNEDIFSFRKKEGILSLGQKDFNQSQKNISKQHKYSQSSFENLNEKHNTSFNSTYKNSVINNDNELFPLKYNYFKCKEKSYRKNVQICIGDKESVFENNSLIKVNNNNDIKKSLFQIPSKNSDYFKVKLSESIKTNPLSKQSKYNNEDNLNVVSSENEYSEAFRDYYKKSDIKQIITNEISDSKKNDCFLEFKLIEDYQFLIKLFNNSCEQQVKQNDSEFNVKYSHDGKDTFGIHNEDYLVIEFYHKIFSWKTYRTESRHAYEYNMKTNLKLSLLGWKELIEKTIENKDFKLKYSNQDLILTLKISYGVWFVELPILLESTVCYNNLPCVLGKAEKLYIDIEKEIANKERMYKDLLMVKEEIDESIKLINQIKDNYCLDN